MGPPYGYEVFHGPTELVYSDPDKAAPGYLLLPSWPRIERYEYIYLINLEGEVVHMWKTVPPGYEGQGYILEKTARLTEKGSIVVGLSTDAHWIAPDHPGLAGRDLTPLGKITDIMTRD